MRMSKSKPKQSWMPRTDIPPGHVQCPCCMNTVSPYEAYIVQTDATRHFCCSPICADDAKKMDAAFGRAHIIPPPFYGAREG
jgi:hypothetical protein